jgi:hypothetical protein
MSFADLVRIAEPVASFYADSPVLRATATFAHFGGFLLGGGFAITTDAATLRAARAPSAEKDRQLAHIHGVHRIVLLGLALTLASGVLMFVADLEALATSPVFWVKMGLVGLLLVNGAVMVRTESALRRGRAGPDWSRLRRSALCSCGLWFAAVLAGTLLVQ